MLQEWIHTVVKITWWWHTCALVWINKRTVKNRCIQMCHLTSDQLNYCSKWIVHFFCYLAYPHEWRLITLLNVIFRDLKINASFILFRVFIYLLFPQIYLPLMRNWPVKIKSGKLGLARILKTVHPFSWTVHSNFLMFAHLFVGNKCLPKVWHHTHWLLSSFYTTDPTGFPGENTIIQFLIDLFQE